MILIKTSLKSLLKHRNENNKASLTLSRNTNQITDITQRIKYRKGEVIVQNRVSKGQAMRAPTGESFLRIIDNYIWMVDQACRRLDRG